MILLSCFSGQAADNSPIASFPIIPQNRRGLILRVGSCGHTGESDHEGMQAPPTSIALYGAGGLGRMVLDILMLRPEWHPVACLDSNSDKYGSTLDGVPVIGGIDSWHHLRAKGVHHVVVAIGDNHERIAIAGKLRDAGATLTSAIHPLAMISTTARLGEHVLIGARVTVCVHADVGDHSVLSPGCIVEHDNQLGEGVFVAPAARFAGNVRIGERTRIGIGATIIPGRRVGANAEVAPGSVVINHVADGVRVSGVPAEECSNTPSRFEADPQQSLPRKVELPGVAAPAI
jgi:UDP-perosamine 4-acetyltransferase